MLGFARQEGKGREGKELTYFVDARRWRSARQRPSEGRRRSPSRALGRSPQGGEGGGLREVNGTTGTRREEIKKIDL